MINPYQFVKILNKLELSAEEFTFGYFIYLSLENQTKFNAEFEKYYLRNESVFDYVDIVNSLEEKGYLINGNRDHVIDFYKIVFTDKFKTLLFVPLEQAWKEVIEIYPLKMKFKDGKSTLLHYSNNPSLKQYYFEHIIEGGNRQLHNEFISLVEYHYDGKKEITEGCGLEKFLYSWTSMKMIINQKLKTEWTPANTVKLK